MSLVTCNAKGETHIKKAAFRCKACGHLVSSEHAGERSHPIACPVCKAGQIPAMSLAALQKDRPELFVGLGPNDLKDAKEGGRIGKLPLGTIYFIDHSNWECLDETTPDCEKHQPFKTTWKDGHPTHTKLDKPAVPTGGEHHARTAQDGTTVATVSE